MWGGINSIGRGKYKDEHDDLQMIVATWGHRFNRRLHMMTEAYYIWQFDAARGGSCIDAPSHDFAPGGGCGAIIPGRTDSIGAVNYFQVLVTKGDYVSIRQDLFWDRQGQRSGFATLYTSPTIGFVHAFNELFMVRPEIRYERAWTNGATPYDNGVRADQVKFAIDGILRF